MADGQVVFEITGDSKNIDQTVKQVTSNIQTESRKWDKAASDSTSKIDSAFSGMLKKIAGYFSAAAIAKKLLEWGKAAVQVASDLREVQNVVDTVFGESSKQIDAWAKDAIKQFGLTETQAKKFSSTLGAMMKTSGLAGDEIVTMSTDLAGLAADMASFYNMDFETSFEKIRSGISGQTMPLKQLGIDMSVANLEAFALAQGLEKTFSQMDQGEQTMLRYQYLMSVTADAQGDFAKTSGDYANGMRLLQSNITTLAEKVGGPLVEGLSTAVGWVNTLIDKLTEEPKKTYIDRLNEIEVDKETKIAEIEEISGYALALEEQLKKLGNGSNLESIAKSANTLNADSKDNWAGILRSFTQVDGLSDMFGDNVGDIEQLALALSGNSPDMSQAEAWQKLLGAMSENKDAVAALTGQDAEGAAAWLDKLATSANNLDAGDAQAWQGLLNELLSGIDVDTEEGRQFVQALSESFLAMGSDSEQAAAGLAALGFGTDEIAQKQGVWLDLCKQLVQTIPGLSSLINTQTGEIKGGLPALEDYVEQWKELAIQEAEIKALQEEIDLWNEAQNKAAHDLEIAKARAPAEAKLQIFGNVQNADQELEKVRAYISAMIEEGKRWEEIRQFLNPEFAGLGMSGFVTSFLEPAKPFGAENAVEAVSPITWYVRGDELDATMKYAEAVYDALIAEKEAPVIEQKLIDKKNELNKKYDEGVDALLANADAAEQAEKEMTALEKAMAGDADAATELIDAYKKAGEALKAVGDYYKSVEDATRNAVNSTVKGFHAVTVEYESLSKKKAELDAKNGDAEIRYATEVSSLRQKFGDNWMEELQALGEESDAWKNLSESERQAYNTLVKLRNEQKEVNDALDEYKPQGMMANLQSQIEFMKNYMDNLEQLKEWGISEELLASLADGSAESASYLQGLVDGGQDAAQEVSDLFDEVAQKKAEFTTDLTDTKLAADQAYQDLVDAAAAALDELNLYDEAKDSMMQTVQGIADGVEEELPEVHSAVQAIIDELNRLSDYGINYEFDAGGNIEVLYGGHLAHYATGTDWIPRNNYPAFLDYGEAVLTAEENKIWQMFKNGKQPSSVDYDTLGGIMRDNVKAGGDVYLEGRVVGQVVSGIQGRNYRNLQRSGWQG